MLQLLDFCLDLRFHGESSVSVLTLMLLISYSELPLQLSLRFYPSLDSNFLQTSF